MRGNTLKKDELAGQHPLAGSASSERQPGSHSLRRSAPRTHPLAGSASNYQFKEHPKTALGQHPLAGSASNERNEEDQRHPLRGSAPGQHPLAGSATSEQDEGTGSHSLRRGALGQYPCARQGQQRHVGVAFEQNERGNTRQEQSTATTEVVPSAVPKTGVNDIVAERPAQNGSAIPHNSQRETAGEGAPCKDLLGLAALLRNSSLYGSGKNPTMEKVHQLQSNARQMLGRRSGAEICAHVPEDSKPSVCQGIRALDFADVQRRRSDGGPDTAGHADAAIVTPLVRRDTHNPLPVDEHGASLDYVTQTSKRPCGGGFLRNHLDNPFTLPRHPFRNNSRLEGDRKCGGGPNNSGSRALRTREGGTGSTPSDIPATGKDDGDCGAFLENTDGRRLRFRGKLFDLREIKEDHPCSDAVGNLVALHQEGGSTRSSTHGSRRQRPAENPATRQMVNLTEVSERDEHLSIEEGEGDVPDTAVRLLIAGGKYKPKQPIPESSRTSFSGELFGFPVAAPPKGRCRLDEFPTGTINYGVVRDLAEEMGKDVSSLDWCTSDNKFQNLSSPVPIPGPSTDLQPSFIRQCQEAGALVKLSRSDAKRGVVSLFTIPKSDPSKHRLLVDGRPINSRLDKPPKFSLITPIRLRESLRRSDAKYAITIDLKGFFNQFPLSDQVSGYFCVRTGATWWRWARLPMGFSHAPLIAQVTSETALGSLLLVAAAVYLDDIVVWGGTALEVRVRAAYVRDRLAKMGAQVNEGKSMDHPSQVVLYLGIEWNLRILAFRFPTEWRVNAAKGLSDCVEGLTHSLRTYWEHLGVLFRVTYVMSLPLAFFCDTLQFIRQQAGCLSSKVKNWDELVSLPSGARNEIRGLIWSHLSTDQWVPIPPPLPTWASVAVWTDASTFGWGCVFSEHGEKHSWASHGTWDGTHTSGEMFFLELRAAAKGVRRAVELGHKHVCLMVDNESVRYVLEKGHSKTRLGNSWLRYVQTVLKDHGATLVTHWLSTTVMPADVWSRKRDTGTAVLKRCKVQVEETKAGFKFLETISNVSI